MHALAFSVLLLRPAWLLVLLALPLFAWLALRGRKSRPRAGDWAAVATRAVLLLAVALALSLPRVEFRAEFRAVAYVLDVSDSVPRDALDRARDFVQRSSSARGPDDDASFLVFADGAAVEVPMSRISSSQRMESIVIDPRNVATRLPTGESAVEDALRLARAGFPPGGARRVVLVTDGNETRGDAAAAVRDLLAEGIDVQVVPVRYERERECWVEKVVAPAASPENAPMPIRVVVSSTHDGVPARIRCLVDGAEVASVDATLAKGRSTFQLGWTFDRPGFHRIEAVLEPATDGNAANNRGAATTQVRGKGRILVASAAPESPLAQALRDGLELAVDAGGPEVLPGDAGGYVPYDAVVLENVPAYGLTEVQRRVLASAVAEMGVGLVCVGGPQAFAPGGYAGTELDEVLPTSSEVSNRRVLPSGALVICLHSCEMPDGNAVGREVSKAAIRALSSDDDVGVLEWGLGGTEWVVPFERVGNKEDKVRLAEGASPGDMPDFDASLEVAAEALAASKASVKHILIISDGDPSPPSDRLQERIATDLRASVSTVCVDPHGGDASIAVMQGLSKRTGGNFYLLRSAERDRIPQIFIKEAVTVRRSAWREEPFRPRIAGVHRMLQEFDEASFPPLVGHTVVTAKGAAELVLVGPDDDPLLATWRHGLGQATSWTSDASPRWAASWVGWSGYGKFWCQVVRASLRAVDRPGVRIATDVEGGTAHVVLDALRPDGTYDNGLRVTGIALRPDGGRSEFRLSQSGPGRYEGSFPAKDVGTYLATLSWTPPDAAPGALPSQALAGVCIAYSAEHLAQRSNERLFATLANAGATVIDVDALDAAMAADPAAPDPARIPWTGEAAATTDPLDLWPWVAGVAALVLVVDVAVRRVRVPWAKLAAALSLRRDERPAGGTTRGAPTVAAGPARTPAGGAFDPSAPPPAAPAPPAGGAASDAGPESGTSQPHTPNLRDAKERARRKQTWEDN